MSTHASYLPSLANSKSLQCQQCAHITLMTLACSEGSHKYYKKMGQLSQHLQLFNTLHFCLFGFFLCKFYHSSNFTLSSSTTNGSSAPSSLFNHNLTRSPKQAHSSHSSRSTALSSRVAHPLELKRQKWHNRRKQPMITRSMFYFLYLNCMFSLKTPFLNYCYTFWRSPSCHVSQHPCAISLRNTSSSSASGWTASTASLRIYSDIHLTPELLWSTGVTQEFIDYAYTFYTALLKRETFSDYPGWLEALSNLAHYHLKYHPKAWCHCWRCTHHVARYKPPVSVWWATWFCTNEHSAQCKGGRLMGGKCAYTFLNWGRHENGNVLTQSLCPCLQVWHIISYEVFTDCLLGALWTGAPWPAHTWNHRWHGCAQRCNLPWVCYWRKI